MSIIKKSIENKEQSSIVKVLKGSIISIITTFVLLFIFALLLAYTNMSERIIAPVVICVSGMSILIGSIISSKRIKKQGLINGGAVGFIYILVIYLISSIIQKDFGFNTNSIIMILVCVFAGALGGIIGVKQKRK